MVRLIIPLLLIVHGSIHLLGFLKAYDLMDVSQLTKDISKTSGSLWLTSFILFILAAILLINEKTLWIPVGFTAVIISQVLIFFSWSDAKYGSIANLLLIIILSLNYGLVQFEKQFTLDVKDRLSKASEHTSEILTIADLQDLPPIVQEYLHFCGVVNKPKIRNFKVEMNGQMRSKGKDYFPFRSIQYNFMDPPARLFYMKGKIRGLTVPGYHKYQNEKATMDIRFFGLFPVVREDGKIMDKTETVTFFNDLCLMAPAALIDKRISWKIIADTVVEAKFNNGQQSISARLYFDSDGKLLNFISLDRTDISDMHSYPFHTPVNSYSNFDQYHLISQGDAIWEYADGPFIYGKFNIEKIEYNLLPSESEKLDF